MRANTISGIVQDLRFALRQLRRAPGFTATAAPIEPTEALLTE